MAIFVGMSRGAVSVMVMVALLLAGGGAGLAQQGPAPFHGDIEKLAKQNRDFRRVLFTGAHTQVVAMSIAAGQDIGAESHPVDQCFFFVEGEGESVVAGKTGKVQDNDVLCVPAGMEHNVRNTGRKALKLYTLYSPPQHPPGTVHHTKADAESAEAQHAR
jgi:mannose-6-phosphate isomerase-like protein (cupin superfamily)